jgi:hypothetical protein
MITVLAIAFGWLRYEKEDIDQKRAVISAIKADGGQAFTVVELQRLGFPIADAPDLPWHRRAIGETADDRPVLIVLPSEFDDGDLQKIRCLSSLTHVVLGTASVSDPAIQQLKADLPKCKVTRSLLP